MTIGNRVVVANPSRGVRLEATVSGTPKPGTHMQLKAATEPVSGAYTWEVFNRAGDAIPYVVALLDFDFLQGKLATDAYVTATRGFVYFPLPGEICNVLVADVAGTGATSDYAIGDEMQIQDDTGLIEDATVGTAFARSRPWLIAETISDMSGDTLVGCLFTGY